MDYDVRLVSSTGASGTWNLLTLGFENPNHVTLRAFMEKVTMSGFDRSKRYTISNSRGQQNATADTLVTGGDTVQVVKSHDNGK